jgi:hypothetical protein
MTMLNLLLIKSGGRGRKISLFAGLPLPLEGLSPKGRKDEKGSKTRKRKG